MGNNVNETLNLVLVILSIGAIVGPVFFGFVFYRMANVFVTRTSFDDYKVLMAAERRHLDETLKRIEENQEKLAQRLLDEVKCK